MKQNNNNTIVLSEEALQNIIKEEVNKILKEGSTDQSVYNKFLDAKERLGADAVLDAIWNYLDSDTLENIVNWLNQDYELWDDEEDSYEEDDTEDELEY